MDELINDTGIQWTIFRNL